MRAGRIRSGVWRRQKELRLSQLSVGLQKALNRTNAVQLIAVIHKVNRVYAMLCEARLKEDFFSVA